MEYTLKPDKENPKVKVLCRDGVPCTCPYKMPIPIPGRMQGQLNILFHNCRTDCALFELKEGFAWLGCSGLSGARPVKEEAAPAGQLTILK